MDICVVYGVTPGHLGRSFSLAPKYLILLVWTWKYALWQAPMQCWFLPLVWESLVGIIGPDQYHWTGLSMMVKLIYIWPCNMVTTSRGCLQSTWNMASGTDSLICWTFIDLILHLNSHMWLLFSVLGSSGLVSRCFPEFRTNRIINWTSTRCPGHWDVHLIWETEVWQLLSL